MLKTDIPRFNELIAKLADTLQVAAPDPQGHFEQLRGWSIEKMEEAFIALAKNYANYRFPVPADFLDTIRSLSSPKGLTYDKERGTTPWNTDSKELLEKFPEFVMFQRWAARFTRYLFDTGHYDKIADTESWRNAFTRFLEALAAGTLKYTPSKTKPKMSDWRRMFSGVEAPSKFVITAEEVKMVLVGLEQAKA